MYFIAKNVSTHAHVLHTVIYVLSHGHAHTVHTTDKYFSSDIIDVLRFTLDIRSLYRDCTMPNNPVMY